MARPTFVFLLLGVAAVLALPSQPQQPDSTQDNDSRISHPEWIPWPPAGWFPEEAPSWWPADREWPPAHPDWIPWPPAHPDWIPFPPEHPEWIPWPPAGWFPEEAPAWWPSGWEWPPPHPESIPWPPQHPESIPWPPTHPEWIPWPPAGWFPEEAPAWWPSDWEWPIPHPDWIPTNPDDLPFLASRDSRFHLFTRQNPSISQPLIFENGNVLAFSNYRAHRRTIFTCHGLNGGATDASNAILVPALLAAADVNVVVMDWSGGAKSTPALSSFYALQSGRFASRFLSWLRQASHGNFQNFHLIGVGIGGWNVGFISRIVNGNIGRVTALDPYLGPAITRVIPPLDPNPATYTEAIHTNLRPPGNARDLGDANFYPNGGTNMPGCASDANCSQLRAVFYFAESVQHGGFTAIRCENAREARQGRCNGPPSIQMGGLDRKRESGVFYLSTNAIPPFSQG